MSEVSTDTRLAPTRFDVARATGAHRDSLVLCVNLLIEGAQKMARSGALLNAIVPIDSLGQGENRKEARKILVAVRADIDEIIAELDRP